MARFEGGIREVGPKLIRGYVYHIYFTQSLTVTGSALKGICMWSYYYCGPSFTKS